MFISVELLQKRSSEGILCEKRNLHRSLAFAEELVNYFYKEQKGTPFNTWNIITIFWLQQMNY